MLQLEILYIVVALESVGLVNEEYHGQGHRMWLCDKHCSHLVEASKEAELIDDAAFVLLCFASPNAACRAAITIVHMYACFWCRVLLSCRRSLVSQYNSDP